MAEKLEIEVLITLDGKVQLTTHGLKGTACLEETASIEKAVGKVTAREKTREYFEQLSASVMGKLTGK